MNQGIHVGLTLYPFLGALFVFLVSFAGVFIAIGRLLNKQKSQCTKIKTIEGSMWKEGRPLLQSVKTCGEERSELNKTCDMILGKLGEMDRKQDKTTKKWDEQMVKIQLHMQKIDLWYIETHKDVKIKRL